ncbi:TonB-dependent vitamin B12 receptor [Novilysobacter selenitireducens]|uniref:TonB-dependent vitamin B12 receptor n=1 Tax=Novilysobacter selenitireducens TaxID=2872639 RepID=A0ABS7T9J0_9GAMM|nr:TonB-dependent vitamin B12 receptor [Lysobacter selenitireducens]MBZ4040544.1 TonB-dependent vitamin B12 receptor [Lysobacter selenitireducens]
MQLRPMTLACALALPLSANAQADTARTARDLDEVVVTATRTPVSANAVLAPVEVIDRDMIVRSQARSLPELLRGRAGVAISNQGGPGKLTTLFMRGAESDHVLVLVDGVRIGSATSGLVSFQDLPLSMIDRVEIVRGPRSSLYGSEAIGGVIQVFTRRDRGGIAPRATATVGSHGRREASAGIGGGSGTTWFGVDAAHQRTDGINACDVATPTPFDGGCFIAAPQPDADGYRNRSLSLRGGIDLGETFELTAQALLAEGENEFDGDFTDYSETTQQVLGARATWTVSDALTVQLGAGRNTDASDNFLGDAFTGYFETDRDSASLQADLSLAADHLLTFGADWLRDRVESDTTFDRTERDNRAAFAQYQGVLGAHSLQAALRHDDNQQFGEATTGNAAWGLSLGGGWRVSAGYGTAFKAPTFNELYYPFFGNPDLRPEESRSWEAGVALDAGAVAWRLDAFDTRVDDLIAYDAALFLPNNIERAQLRGAELGIDAEVAAWAMSGSVSVLDTENRSGGFNDGNELPRRARRSARLDVDRAFGDLRLGLTGVAEGARFDDVANTRRLGGYATFDVRAEYSLTAAWTVQARLANVLDRDYETASFYNLPGREWFLTLRWEPAQ